MLQLAFFADQQLHVAAKKVLYCLCHVRAMLAVHGVRKQSPNPLKP
jgi:hypothetical protein